MVKPRGRQIPVHRDNRTFEQRRQDLVKDLEKKCKKDLLKKSKQGGTSDTHQKQLTSGDWFDEVDRWIDETNKRWSHDWNRAWGNMFSLVPVDSFDLDPVATFGPFGTPTYVPSILSRMDHQMAKLRQNLDQLIPDYQPDLMERAKRGYQGALMPLGGLSDTRLDYLKEAYEPGEDGQLRFKLRFDLRGYGPDDIHVETDKNRLTVHAKKTVKTEGASETSEFCRTLYLPDKVDEEHFQSHLTKDGILTVEAPVKQAEVSAIKFDRERQLGIQPHSEQQNLALKPIGKPGATILAEGAGPTRLHVEVPVEQGFTPDELHVSTVGNQLVVSGKHEAEEDFGPSGKSRHVREFHRSYPIPTSVDPLSLQALLSGNTLVVEGPVVQTPQ